MICTRSYMICTWSYMYTILHDLYLILHYLCSSFYMIYTGPYMVCTGPYMTCTWFYMICTWPYMICNWSYMICNDLTWSALFHWLTLFTHGRRGSRGVVTPLLSTTNSFFNKLFNYSKKKEKDPQPTYIPTYRQTVRHYEGMLAAVAGRYCYIQSNAHSRSECLNGCTKPTIRELFIIINRKHFPLDQQAYTTSSHTS